MKKLHTLLCCICMAILGGFLAILQPNESRGSYNTISAAPVLHLAPGAMKLPLDLQLDLEKKYNRDGPTEVIRDTVYADTLFIDKSIPVKHKRKVKSTLPSAQEKRMGYDIPVINPDSPAMEKVDVDREEHTTDTIGPPKASIILIIDGKEVYKR